MTTASDKVVKASPIRSPRSSPHPPLSPFMHATSLSSSSSSSMSSPRGHASAVLGRNISVSSGQDTTASSRIKHLPSSSTPTLPFSASAPQYMLPMNERSQSARDVGRSALISPSTTASPCGTLHLGPPGAHARRRRANSLQLPPNSPGGGGGGGCAGSSGGKWTPRNISSPRSPIPSADSPGSNHAHPLPGGLPLLPNLCINSASATASARAAAEHALEHERARAKSLEKDELPMDAAELRVALKRERAYSGRVAADLAAMKSATVSSQAEAEAFEEGRINSLMRRLEGLYKEKGRMLVELEREEEKLTNNLQKQLNEVRREKAILERQIEREKHQSATSRSSIGSSNEPKSPPRSSS